VSATAKHPWVFPLPNGKAAPKDRWTLDQGVDIAAPAHTPLLAVGSGTIVHHGIGGFGNDSPVLHLDTGQNVYYGHAGPGNRLPDGTRVKAGQVIGEVGAGQVGRSSGPHLEIGLSDARGTPLGRQTAPGFKNMLLSAKDPSGGGSTLSTILNAPENAGKAAAHALNQALGLPDPNPSKSVTGNVQDLGQKAGGKAQDAAANLAADAVKGVFGGFFDDVKKQAPRAMLFLLLTIGGLALAGYGTARLFGVQQPVKSTVGAVRKSAKAATVAGI
jgi:hypothetical protein